MTEVVLVDSSTILKIWVTGVIISDNVVVFKEMVQIVALSKEATHMIAAFSERVAVSS